MSPNRAVRALAVPLLAVALLGACGGSKRVNTSALTTTSTTAAPETTASVPRVTAGTSEVTAIPLATSSSTSKVTTPATSKLTTPPTSAGTTTTAGPATTTTSNAASGSISGTVTSSPSCPVERPDQPCPPKPVQATVSARRADGSTAASARSDSAGRYQLTVPAGSYTLVVDPGNVYPRCPETAVSVPAGGSATADIACDSGIR